MFHRVAPRRAAARTPAVLEAKPTRREVRTRSTGRTSVRRWERPSDSFQGTIRTCAATWHFSRGPSSHGLLAGRSALLTLDARTYARCPSLRRWRAPPSPRVRLWKRSARSAIAHFGSLSRIDAMFQSAYLIRLSAARPALTAPLLFLAPSDRGAPILRRSHFLPKAVQGQSRCNCACRSRTSST
jgi:hypothetical protein